MYYRELTLRAELPEQIFTEILFEVASARADNIELLCINIISGESPDFSQKKQFSSVIKVLKKMKTEGKIQLFATCDSFKGQKTEAFFLQNKYPNLFGSFIKLSELDNTVYIKI